MPSRVKQQELSKTSKGVCKATLFRLEKTMTVHIVLFYAIVNLNISTSVAVHIHFNQSFFVLCRVKVKEQNILR